MRWSVPCLLGLAACANMPDVQRDVCGNAIREAGEDCDGVPENGQQRCVPPGEEGACHWDCSSGEAGTRWQCPGGWACDADEICREPTGGFERARLIALGDVDSLQAGDFDGDGRADLVSRNPSDLADRATLRFHYFDARGALVDTRPFPKLMMTPSIGKLSSDGLDDLVFSDFRVGVLLGRADHTWVPEAFTPYVLPGGLARVTGLTEGYVSAASSLASLASLGEGPGVYVPDVARNTTALRASINVPLETLLGDPLAAQLIEGPPSPCDELVLAFAGQTSFSMYELCEPELPDGSLVWKPAAVVKTIALDPPAPLDAPPLAADLNGDGFLDVLVGAGGSTYAAFGDGMTLGTATPFSPLMAPDSPPMMGWSMPLAVADLSGDLFPDFVLKDRIYMSRLPSEATLPYYALAWMNASGSWTSAKVADLNGNGFLDLVATQRDQLHVDFFNGSGRPWLLQSKVLTTRPVAQLATGDIDGDLIGDLVTVEQGANAMELDTVKVAFGALAQAPGTPQAVARARSVKQVGIYREASTDSILVVADHPTTNENVTYLLGGNSERIPFAALELLRFSKDGSLGNVVSTALVLGAFSGTSSKDALTLGFDTVLRRWQFWMVPTLGSASPSAYAVAGGLDARLTPSADIGDKLDFPAAEIYAVGTAADLDRDGRDESIWVMPAEQNTRCGLEILRVSGQPESFALGSGGVVLLDGVCADPQVRAVDADQDGFLDLVVLIGNRTEESTRKLFVLWNDGTGRFASERSTLINSNGELPQAFTTLPRTETMPFRVVYATRGAVTQWRYAEQRTFAAPVRLDDLRDGTSIVAADLNGDGATDLAVADDGDLHVLTAAVR
ncbi:MAG: VCBS repeat-containing protein [Polyangiales bacterium]